MLGLLLLLFASGLTPIESNGYKDLVRGYRGNVVLVSFWATWCVPCRTELPALGAMQKKVPGFRLVTISADDPDAAEKAEKFLRESGVEGRGYIRNADESDDKFIPAVDPKWSGALPANFLYGRDGRLIRSFIGEAKVSDIESAVIKEGRRASLLRLP